MDKEIFNRQKMALDVRLSLENLLCKETLAAEIRLTFSHSVRPDKDSLIIPCPGDPEHPEIRDQYATFAWDKVPERMLSTQCDTLYFFTPEGFRYYLPVFMLSATERYDAEEQINNMLIWSLIYHPEDADFRTKQLVRFTGFSSAQGSAILHFPVCMEVYHNGDFINPADHASELRKTIGNWWTKYKKEET